MRIEGLVPVFIDVKWVRASWSTPFLEMDISLEGSFQRITENRLQGPEAELTEPLPTCVLSRGMACVADSSESGKDTGDPVR